MIIRLLKKLVFSVWVTFSWFDAVLASPALSNKAPSVSQGIMQMLPMFAIFIVILYFMMIRPQNKKAKEKKKLMDSIQAGDEVMTAGGIVAKIDVLADSYVIVALSEGNKMTLQRSSIASVLPKGTLASIK